MEYLQLGSTHERVPKIGFGTARYHGGTGVLARAAALGAGFIDTAEAYNVHGEEPGVAERTVANDLEGVPERVFVATKISPAHFRFDDVIAHAQASRERLRVETIDLYQLHAPNPTIPIAETMRAMEQLADQGVIRYLGVSNFSVDQTRAAQDALERHPLVSNQVRFNLFDRAAESDVLPYCQAHGITLIAHTPLVLGRFDRGPVARPLARVADETGKTRAQVLLNWLVSHAGVMAIPKTDRLDRVDELVGSVGWELDADQVRSLEAAG